MTIRNLAHTARIQPKLQLPNALAHVEDDEESMITEMSARIADCITKVVKPEVVEEAGGPMNAARSGFFSLIDTLDEWSKDPSVKMSARVVIRGFLDSAAPERLMKVFAAKE